MTGVVTFLVNQKNGEVGELEIIYESEDYRYCIVVWTSIHLPNLKYIDTDNEIVNLEDRHGFVVNILQHDTLDDLYKWTLENYADEYPDIEEYPVSCFVCFNGAEYIANLWGPSNPRMLSGGRYEIQFETLSNLRGVFLCEVEIHRIKDAHLIYIETHAFISNNFNRFSKE